MIIEVIISILFALCLWKMVEIITKRGGKLIEAKKLTKKSSMRAKDNIKKTLDKAIKELAKGK